MVLDPRSICEQFHMCSQVLLQREVSHDWSKGAVDQIMFNNNHAIRTMDNKNLMSPKVNHKPQMQHSGQITFVQISDIHLDLQYAEVHVHVHVYYNTDC